MGACLNYGFELQIKPFCEAPNMLAGEKFGQECQDGRSDNHVNPVDPVRRKYGEIGVFDLPGENLPARHDRIGHQKPVDYQGGAQRAFWL
jgi:hypothetical protein